MRIGKRARPESGEAVAKPQSIGRRRLLSAAGIASVAAALPETAGGEPASTAAGPADPGSLSYRETDHIRWFYARSRM
jgi:hypothetical protein